MTYTNYRGETAVRRIRPIRIEVSSSEWHPKEQLVLVALDLDKNEERNFAVADIGENGVLTSGG